MFILFSIFAIARIFATGEKENKKKKKHESTKKMRFFILNFIDLRSKNKREFSAIVKIGDSSGTKKIF